MKRFIAAGAASLFCLGAAAFAQAPAAQDFVNQAASGGMFEVQSSELALERASGDAVKAFAQMMVTDHSANNEELKAAAEAEGLTVPAEIMGKPAEQLQAVQAAEGEQFDPVYTTEQVAAHEAAVALYESYVEGGDNDALKAYAEKSLPVLRQHLEQASGLAGQ